MLVSCEDYLNIEPKGQKIPTTLADYEALLRDEYAIGQTPVANALYLLNDYYVRKSALATASLTRANYLWDESANRIQLNSTSENTFYYLYATISSCNLLIEHVPTATEATDAERNEVIAYAKVIRSLCYFVLCNYYADTYETATASTKLSVPLITSADIDAPYEQVTIQRLYDFIIQNIKEAIDGGLPEQSMTIIHPNLGAAYALLARVYLQMSNFTEALRYADLALLQNDMLYDWNGYYDQFQDMIEDPSDYSTLPTPMGYDYVENYYFRHGDGSPNYPTGELMLPVERAGRFEDGDAKFMSRWKLFTENMDTYYRGIGRGYFNWGGLTTCEMYLIKAECLARQASGANYSIAMAALNRVRETRIRPNDYQPLSATTLAEAIEHIRRTKDNELIFSIVPFADARRFNAEGTFARTMTKTVDGQTLTLRPDSHLWTMPFPAGAIGNPGNGTFTQNVAK
jgi:hypothetical protein